MLCFGKRHRAPTAEELRKLLPPSLLIRVAETRVPLETSRRLKYEEVADLSEQEYCFSWPLMLALSKYGLDTALSIDFLAADVLPSPKHRTFPKLALGLILILDQIPRALFHGVNSRYCSSYFDPMAQKLFAQLLALPEELRPWSRERWTEEQEYTVDQWIFAEFWFLAPQIHHESLQSHESALSTWRATRPAIAASNDGLQDPYAKLLEGSLGKDTFAMSRELTRGPPTEETLGRIPVIGDAFYWWIMIFYVHRPIIATYGRYPYRNAQVGRVSTEKEEIYLEQTGRFGEIDQASAALIKQDVDRGVWRPLKRDT